LRLIIQTSEILNIGIPQAINYLSRLEMSYTYGDSIFAYRRPITNRQKFVALSSLVEGLSLKVTGIKCPQTSDDSLFAYPSRIISDRPQILNRQKFWTLPA